MVIFRNKIVAKSFKTGFSRLYVRTIYKPHNLSNIPSVDHSLRLHLCKAQLVCKNSQKIYHASVTTSIQYMLNLKHFCTCSFLGDQSREPWPYGLSHEIRKALYKILIL